MIFATSNEDPGALFLTTAYQAFDPETINAAFGHVGAKVYNGEQGIVVTMSFIPHALGSRQTR